VNQSDKLFLRMLLLKLPMPRNLNSRSSQKKVKKVNKSERMQRSQNMIKLKKKIRMKSCRMILLKSLMKIMYNKKQCLKLIAKWILLRYNKFRSNENLY